MPIDSMGRYVPAMATASQPQTASGVVNPVRTASGVVYPQQSSNMVSAARPSYTSAMAFQNGGGTVDYGGATNYSVAHPSYVSNPNRYLGWNSGVYQASQQQPPQPQQPAGPTNPAYVDNRTGQPVRPEPSPTANTQSQQAPTAPQGGPPTPQAPGAGQLPPGWQPPPQYMAPPQQAWGGQNYGQAQGMAPANSMNTVERAANNGNPQSVQNFMSALNAVGAGGNNNFMNAPGQLGAGPQGGFVGFQQNGMAPQGPQAVMAGGPQMMNASVYGNQYGNSANAAMGYNNYGVNNAAYANGNYGAGNSAQVGIYGFGSPPWAGGGQIQTGGTGGVQGQPQWTTPGPWGNPENNAPGAPGSLWGGGSSQDWQNYLFAQPGQLPPGYQQQQGSMYSSNPTDGSGGTVTSDIQAKTNIKDGQSELQEFLNALGVYSYEYKDKKYGEGERISPMAQEIEKSQLGKAAISTNAEGYKQVDYGKLAGTQLAALALLNHKYNQLEKKLKEAISTNLRNRKK